MIRQNFDYSVKGFFVSFFFLIFFLLFESSFILVVIAALYLLTFSLLVFDTYGEIKKEIKEISATIPSI